jgi:hypothetical protein
MVKDIDISKRLSEYKICTVRFSTILPSPAGTCGTLHLARRVTSQVRRDNSCLTCNTSKIRFCYLTVAVLRNEEWGMAGAQRKAL